jgi:Icc-related predicted phosphoesterase
VKFLCVSDHIDPLVYSPNIKNRFRDIDAVIGAGDLPLYYYDYIVSNLNKPLVFVFGNHHLKNIHLYKKRYGSFRDEMDSRYDDLPRSGGIYINQRVKNIKNCLVAGLGGTPWYNGEPNQFSEFNMYMKTLTLIPHLIWNRLFHGRFLDILVTHAPPLGIGDGEDRCHRGFKAFLWFIRVFKPRFLLHGHVHLYDHNAHRTHRYHETTVVNVYNHYVLEIEDSTHLKIGQSSL